MVAGAMITLPASTSRLWLRRAARARHSALTTAKILWFAGKVIQQKTIGTSHQLLSFDLPPKDRTDVEDRKRARRKIDSASTASIVYCLRKHTSAWKVRPAATSAAVHQRIESGNFAAFAAFAGSFSLWSNAHGSENVVWQHALRQLGMAATTTSATVTSAADGICNLLSAKSNSYIAAKNNLSCCSR